MSRSVGVVVCPQPVAAEAGVAILEGGGNAVDAAIAVAFLQMVLDPPMAGLGGFGTMLYRGREGGTVSALDFPSHAGGATHPDQWLDKAGEALPDRFGYAVEGLINDVGYQSVGVPGVVAGLGTAHEAWGSMPWAKLLDPAIRASHDGVAVTKSARDFWLEDGIPGRASGFERMTATPASAEIFAPTGELLRAGDLMRQPDMGRTLEHLADRGFGSFYEGEIAAAIVDDFAANGGHVTREDLAGYRAQMRDPLRTGYRDWTVFSAPPPSGGQMVAQALRLLERFDLAATRAGTYEVVSLLVEAMKYGIHGRMEVGPHAEDGALERILDPATAEEFVRTVAGGGKIEVDPMPAYEASTTTQVTVIDQDGTIVSLTHSLGYGSGVVTPGLGFLYNNYMNVFNPYPGHPDSIRPGARRWSGMSPTIVLDSGGDPVAALGAPGATRITSAVLQSTVNYLDFGMTPVEAVSAPRVDCQGATVEVENRIEGRVTDALEEAGYEVNRRDQNYDPYFARPQMIAKVDGEWRGASDPRRDGGIARYEAVKGS
ncbi:MAG TPA: gamma-glutamyltransferase [Solirubrobacterales bacterium]|jgi:gamma-glutamyltranspeptidase/glutathione hydrolase|nr:gamma-glutamyltransferase [Solirubrobacterales bacterium]